MTTSRRHITELPPEIRGPETITKEMVEAGERVWHQTKSVVQMYAAMRGAQINGWVKVSQSVACPRGCWGYDGRVASIEPGGVCICGWGNWPTEKRRQLARALEKELNLRAFERNTEWIVESDQVWTAEDQFRKQNE